MSDAALNDRAPQSWWSWWVRVSEPVHFLGWLLLGLVVGRHL